MVWAFARLDATEDFSYPMALLFYLLGAILPAFVYFFVAELFESEGRAASSAVGDYYTFLVIGLAIAALLQSAMTGFGGRLQYAQDRGTFETLLVEPVPWTLIPLLMNVWRLLLGVLTASLLLAVGGLLGADYRLSGLATFAGVVLLGVLASSAVGIISASLLVLAKRSAPVLSLYGLAASLFAGTLFPIDLIPAWLRWISFLVPHTYVIALGRRWFMAAPPQDSVAPDLAVTSLLLFVLVALGLGVPLFSRALQYSRRTGLLSGY
ncbi:MAG TPA: ABC transporter permease [Nitriliruptorales bacterium]|nr:ABC transporter permease [Nitriliruptorales bacterium]